MKRREFLAMVPAIVLAPQLLANPAQRPLEEVRFSYPVEGARCGLWWDCAEHWQVRCQERVDNFHTRDLEIVNQRMCDMMDFIWKRSQQHEQTQ